jgi:hypothetical protein
MMLDALIEKVQRFGIEGVFSRFYGIYVAIVEDVADPSSMGRIRVQVPALGQRRAPADLWARPATFGGSEGTGLFFAPNVGDKVWVSFEAGNPDKPVYFGGFMGNGKAAAEFGSYLKRGFKTPAGHYVRVSDEDSDQHITMAASNGAYATMNKDGDLLMSSAEGSYINLSAADRSTTIHDVGGALLTMKDGEATLISKEGVVIKVGASGVTIISGKDAVINAGGNITLKSGTVNIGSNAMEPVVLGASFMAYFNAHTHATPVGPSSPPVAPMTTAQLSQTVKTT